MGGMPFSVKRARLRQSATISRSPCTTWISKPVWLSSCVVYVARAAAGMVVLRGRILSTTPPPDLDAERQREHVEEEHVVLRPLPASKSACTAAPSATTSSGSMSPSGSRPKTFATYARTAGTRVAPPTRITPSSCSGLSPASLSARRQASPVRSSSGSNQRVEARTRHR